MKITNQKFAEERALFRLHDSEVESCTFSGKEDGESPLKESNNLLVTNCNFDLRYALWHAENSQVKNCEFSSLARAPFWYDKNVKFEGINSNSPKAFRECEKLELISCKVISEEPFWKIRKFKGISSDFSGFYGFFMCKDLYLDNIKFDGKYSFQYCKNVVIKNSILNTKDAFWHASHVRVENSKIKGEYIGWYSRNLVFVNCTIESHQGFCHCDNIKFVNCKMPNSDLVFEDSTIKGNIIGRIESIKNPRRGKIIVDEVGSIIQEKPNKIVRVGVK